MSPVSPAAEATLRQTGRQCARSIRRTFAAHLPLYLCSLVFCGLTLAFAAAWRLPLSLSPSLVFIETIPQFLMLAVGLAAAAELLRLFRSGSADPLRALWRWLHSKVFAEDRPGNVFHSLVTFTPLMIAFSALKDEIPRIHPFAWDQAFTQWDKMLGFGELPWRILQPVLGYPAITAGLNFFYDFWFVVMFGALLWQAFAPRGSILRTQFLLAFAFSWFIAGNVLAVIFSSAGPCFYGHFFTQNPYAEQMDYLRAVAAHWPVWSIRVQDLLWHSYATGSGTISGISAMPSMHVIVAVLVALLGWRHDRRLGTALWLFAGVIVIGSVHLAWHYAVDAFAGIALAWIFWRVAGLIARAEARQRRTAEPPAEPVTA